MGVENNIIDQYTDCIHEIKRVRHAIMPLEENRRKYTLFNNSGLFITKIKIEGCVAKGWGEKGCEALLLVESAKNKNYVSEKAFLVELKGCAVKDALKQIDSSFERTKSFLKGTVLYGRIVPSEYKRNKFLSNYEQKLYLKFKATGGDLVIREKLSDTI